MDKKVLRNLSYGVYVVTRDYFDGLYINEQQCETIQYRTYD